MGPCSITPDEAPPPINDPDGDVRLAELRSNGIGESDPVRLCREENPYFARSRTAKPEFVEPIRFPVEGSFENPRGLQLTRTAKG